MHTYAVVDANAFLEHACVFLEHTYAVLEHSSVFLFNSGAFPTHLLSVWKHFILISFKKLGFWQKMPHWVPFSVICSNLHNIFCFNENSVINHSHSKHLVYVQCAYGCCILFCVESAIHTPNIYHIFVSRNTCYYLENQLFVQRSQYIRTENPLHKQSEKAKTVTNRDVLLLATIR